MKCLPVYFQHNTLNWVSTQSSKCHPPVYKHIRSPPFSSFISGTWDMGHGPFLYLLPPAPSSNPDLSTVTSLVERHMPCSPRKATEVTTGLNVSLGWPCLTPGESPFISMQCPLRSSHGVWTGKAHHSLAIAPFHPPPLKSRDWPLEGETVALLQPKDTYAHRSSLMGRVLPLYSLPPSLRQ